MKLALISDVTGYVKPSYNYADPVNAEVYWIAEELAKKGHEVSMVTRTGSVLPEGVNDIPHNQGTEQDALKDYGEKISDSGCVLDFSNEKWTTTIRDEKKLKAVYVCHPKQGYQNPPPITFPCFVGASPEHAMNLSGRLGIAVRYLPWGVKFPVERKESKDYILYFGRVVKERGCHEFVSICRKNQLQGIIAGDDINVDQPYVQSILKSCDGTRIRYFGAVTDKVRATLISEAKALVIPYLSDNDAYALLTVKMAYSAGVPVVSMKKGEFADDIYIPGFFLAGNLEGLYSIDYDHLQRPDARAKFTIEQTITVLESLINEAINNPW